MKKRSKWHNVAIFIAVLGIALLFTPHFGIKHPDALDTMYRMGYIVVEANPLQSFGEPTVFSAFHFIRHFARLAPAHSFASNNFQFITTLCAVPLLALLFAVLKLPILTLLTSTVSIVISVLFHQYFLGEAVYPRLYYSIAYYGYFAYGAALWIVSMLLLREKHKERRYKKAD